ncbi:MAG: hypothetical protein KGL39_18210 [Patescibacteria group bacterium]|nr:hypothetical protein [Patescibacteria group bacterium]
MAAKKKGESVDRLAAIASVARRFSAFQPASEVFTAVKSVQTIFPQFDVATKVGGFPIERVSLIHGPSNEGKTAFAIGVGKSFLVKDHFFGFVDAEFSTPVTWLNMLMGNYVNHPGFVAMHPTSFEKTRDSVKEFLETIAEAKDKGDIDKDTSALVVVDSIRKLVPERLMDALKKDAEKVGLDGMSGRGAQYKAALLAQWLDELVPLIYHTNSGILLITRETEKPNAGPYEQQYVIAGGKAPIYESSIAARISRNFIKEADEVVGERHTVRIWKTKIGSKEGKYVDGHFHTSNGASSPAGFDISRDILEMAVDCGIINKKSGKHWFTRANTGFGEGEVFADSEAEAIKFLRELPAEKLYSLETLVRNEYVPQEHDISEQGR